jgi:hypothetical protein
MVYGERATQDAERHATLSWVRTCCPSEVVVGACRGATAGAGVEADAGESLTDASAQACMPKISGKTPAAPLTPSALLNSHSDPLKALSAASRRITSL